MIAQEIEGCANDEGTTVNLRPKWREVCNRVRNAKKKIKMTDEQNGCHSACKIAPVMEWALGAGQNQTADLTMNRVCCSSNCTGLM